MSKRFEIYLSDELAAVIEAEAASMNVKGNQLIPDILAKALKDKLYPAESFAHHLKEMKAALLEYITQIPDDKEFCLRDVPYYNTLPSSVRIRLGRTINEMINGYGDDKSLTVIQRVYRSKDGTLKFHSGSAIYQKRKVKNNE